MDRSMSGTTTRGRKITLTSLSSLLCSVGLKLSLKPGVKEELTETKSLVQISE
jgi:hypothetical protein